ncbi:MAG: hypothetical protein F4X21_10080 [Acidimicrobiia bacterium]|nr:ATP-binding protein [bacterium]MYD05251.1 hypothetical protein [Acidimicrobiia bacterium]MYF26755.1 hypothetical protein [Acidimicrobiia bacterium]MYH56253.1 hypothetical protein [Acidimicrobiia bacterium]
MSLTNPFVPTYGATPPLLAGRNRVITRFESALQHGPTHPDYTLLLTGRQGYGKTVLLNSVEAIARDNGWSVVSLSASSGRFRSELLSGVGGSVAERQPSPPASIPPLIRTVLTAAADHMAEQGAGLLVTVDELQAVDPMEMREFANAIQHITRRELRPLAFVGAALPEVEDTLLADPGMTFFQRCARAPLSALSKDDTHLAIEYPIRNSGGHIDADALAAAVEHTAGFPFMVQLVGFHSWDICVDPAAGIALKDVEAGVVESLEVLVEQIIQPLWKALSPVDKAFLFAMAQDDTVSHIADIADRLGRDGNYVNYYRARLIQTGVVVPEGRGRLCFAHPVMRTWLLHPSRRDYPHP